MKNICSYIFSFLLLLISPLSYAQDTYSINGIDGYTWHHNAQSAPNNIQLIPRDVHDAAKHIGEASLSEGR